MHRMSDVVFQGLEPLFHSPLVAFTLPGGAALNELLIAEVCAMRLASPGAQRSNHGGWHSADDLFDRQEAGCQALCRHIVEAARQATLRIAPTFDFSQFGLNAEGWFNVNQAGDCNAPHDHPGWVWSGAYYVQVPAVTRPRSGAIEFLDHRTNVRVLTVEQAPCFAAKFTVEPQAGQLLLFPSYLRHWVYPNGETTERISVAFNLRFVRR
jgi:uncharacterized protein (TIGR02466 family)